MQHKATWVHIYAHGHPNEIVINPINRLADGCPAREQEKMALPYSIFTIPL